VYIYKHFNIVCFIVVTWPLHFAHWLVSRYHYLAFSMELWFIKIKQFSILFFFYIFFSIPFFGHNQVFPWRDVKITVVIIYGHTKYVIISFVTLKRKVKLIALHYSVLRILADVWVFYAYGTNCTLYAHHMHNIMVVYCSENIHKLIRLSRRTILNLFSVMLCV